MNRYFLAVLFLFSFLIAKADDRTGYKYSVDLTSVSDDKVIVELIAPHLSGTQAMFRFPKVVPGTYSVYNFGRFISELKATDQQGNEIQSEKIDINSWKISNAQNVYKIVYTVDDSYDAKDGDKVVFEPVGTSIEEGKVFMINNHAYFGYFDEMKDREYNITVTKPVGFYGSTSLTPIELNATTDQYIVPSYYLLVDSPIMYNIPDTTIIDVGGTQVLVSSYSPSKMITSKMLADNIRDILYATKDYLGSLPVEKYAFIYSFHSGPSPSGLDGALEHSYSSLYSFPEVAFSNLEQTVKNTAAHEFLHIITPLNIHSEEIHNFDYNDPKMSQHLWMYEGITEYTSRIVQVKAGLMTMDHFFDDITEKINTSLRYDNTLAFTDFSTRVLDETYNKQFINVYNKGAMIGMLLDIKLRSLSGGKYGVREMMKELSVKYGKEMAFKDPELFDAITAMTYPEIRDFFRMYVEGTQPLPYKEILALAGVSYYKTKSDKQISFGTFDLGYSPLTKRLFVSSVSSSDNVMGFKKGDEWVSFNKKPIVLAELQGHITTFFDNAKEGDELEMQVIRKDAAGNEKTVKLKGDLKMKDVEVQNVVELMEGPTETQRMVFNAWTGKN